jgi:hypothetical protein
MASASSKVGSSRYSRNRSQWPRLASDLRAGDLRRRPEDTRLVTRRGIDGLSLELRSWISWRTREHPWLIKSLFRCVILEEAVEHRLPIL